MAEGWQTAGDSSTRIQWHAVQVPAPRTTRLALYRSCRITTTSQHSAPSVPSVTISIGWFPILDKVEHFVCCTYRGSWSLQWISIPRWCSVAATVTTCMCVNNIIIILPISLVRAHRPRDRTPLSRYQAHIIASGFNSSGVSSFRSPTSTVDVKTTICLTTWWLRKIILPSV